MTAEEPTLADLEQAITFNAQACRRYGRYWKGYARCHEEINHLLDDRDLAMRALQDRINEGLRRMNGSGKLVTNEESRPLDPADSDN